VAIKKQNATSTEGVPSSYQIWKGYDSQNNEVKSAKVEVLEANLEYDFSFDLLEPGSVYSVYVTAGSNHPDFPDLLSEGAMVSIETATKDNEELETSSAFLIKVNVLLLILFFILN
jgi:hypothetical protein